MWSAFFNVLAHFAVGFVIGLFIVSIVGAIWNKFKHHLNKKRVLQAITDLGIEEELANCVAGCNARCSLAIYKYFVEHGWGNPFVGAFDNLYLCCLINELRAEGKIKPIYDNLMSMKKKSDGHKNAVMLRNAEEMK